MVELPFPIVRIGERRPLAGWLLSASGWAIIMSFLSLWMYTFNYFDELNGFLGGIGILIWIVIITIFYFFFFPRAVLKLIARGRRMRAPRATDILSHDNRAPIVLLRSFADDDLIDPSFPIGLEIVPGRYENRLMKGLRVVGPALALGRPGEPEPELGAARLYVEDQHWQQAIRYLIMQAKAVVVVVGGSSGLWWEIELALAQVPPERLLFFFPYPVPREYRRSYLRSTFLLNPFWGRWLRRRAVPEMEAEREKRYQAFQDRFGMFFKNPLPPALAGARFLHVDSKGYPQLLDPARPSLLVRLMTMNLKSGVDIPFKRELRPFVEKLGFLGT